MDEVILSQAAARPVSLFWGIVFPAVIFLVSFALTYALYLKFSRK